MSKLPTAKAASSVVAALLWLLGLAAFGQSPIINRQAKEIKERVQAISQDTLRRAAFGPAADLDTVRRPQQLLFLDRYTAYYTPAGSSS